jgi:hypothetical protein
MQAPDNSTQSNGWVDHTGETELKINDVEQFLHKTVTKEIQVVNSRMLNRIRGIYGAAFKAEEVKLKHIAAVWLPGIVNLLFKRANKHRTLAEMIRVDEIIGFIADECYMSYYGKSPQAYFCTDPTPRCKKPPSGLTYSRYTEILHCFSSRSTVSSLAGDKECIGEFMDNFWDRPMAPNSDLSTAQKEIRYLCAGLGFVGNVSVLGIDDDLIRNRCAPPLFS